MKWLVYQWRNCKRIKVGFVEADHQPAAVAAAWKKYPKLKPTKDHPHGTQWVEMENPPPKPPRVFSDADIAVTRKFTDAINGMVQDDI